MIKILQIIIAFSGCYIGIEVLTTPVQTWWAGVATILICLAIEKE